MAEGGLLERLQRLEDLEALKELKYCYCAACDNNYDAEAVAALFTEDGIWDGGIYGCYEGRAAIFATFQEAKNSVKFVLHHVGNPIIELDADSAICRWYLWLAKINRDGDRSMLFAGTYHDLCVRQAGQWYFKRMTLQMQDMPPLGGQA